MGPLMRDLPFKSPMGWGTRTVVEAATAEAAEVLGAAALDRPWEASPDSAEASLRFKGESAAKLRQNASFWASAEAFPRCTGALDGSSGLIAIKGTCSPLEGKGIPRCRNVMSNRGVLTAWRRLIQPEGCGQMEVGPPSY